MEKKELASILSEILVPIGFKKKGNYWVVNGTEITKMVNLQKSQFSNSFYINYGYIINAIPLGNLMMHIYNRVTSLDIEERNRITFLLDLESNIPDDERASDLKKVLLEKLVHKLSAVNTEADVLEELKKRTQLNDIPLVVKRHFNLPE
jgi:hypothetical protein